MASWAALNAELPGPRHRRESPQQQQQTQQQRREEAAVAATAEALEAQHAARYEHALRCQHRREAAEAMTIYRELLGGGPGMDPRLRYLCAKNLAALEVETRACDAAVHHFAEALEIDDTDVLVWYQLGKAAIETDRLWLARQALESAFERDPAFWPGVQGLCEVLAAIGDYGEYARVAAYLLEHDPDNGALRAIDAHVVPRAHAVAQGPPSTSPSAQQSLVVPPVADPARKRDREHASRLQEAIALRAKRRRQLEDTERAAVARWAARPPVDYLLQRRSWHSLGQLLLQAYEDVVQEADDLGAPPARVRIAVDFSAEPPTPSKPRPTTTAPEVVDVTGDESPGTGATADDDTNKPPAAPTEVVVDLVASDNPPGSDHDGVGDAPTTRRKSRRHENRLREEHETAVRLAREKNLQFRLQTFLETLRPGSDELGDGPGVLCVAFEGTTVKLLVNEERETAEGPVLSIDSGLRVPTTPRTAAPASAAAGPRADGNDKETIGVDDVAEHLHKQQILEFVTRYAAGDSGDILRVLREYLNHCGAWYNVQLSSPGDAETIHQICFWAEKAVHGRLGASGGTTRPQGLDAFDAQSRVTMLRPVESGLTMPARLFLLELHVDHLLSNPPGRRKKTKQGELEEILVVAQRLLVDHCLGESDGAHAHDTGPSFFLVRLFWLCGLVKERLGDANAARDDFVKCLEELGGAGGAESPTVCRPNQGRDPLISEHTLKKKIAGLQYYDVCEEARKLFALGQFDGAQRALLNHFFPESGQCRLDELTRDYAAHRDRQVVSPSSSSSLLELLVDAIEGGSASPDVKIVSLVSMLHAVLNEIETSRRAQSTTNDPEKEEHEACVATLSVVQFLIGRLKALSTRLRDETTLACHQLVCAWAVRLLQPSVILIFESPREVFNDVLALHDVARLAAEATKNRHVYATLFEAVVSTFRAFLSLPANDIQALGTVLVSSAGKKKKSSPRERMRMLLVEVFHFLNQLADRMLDILSQARVCSLLSDCCKLLKEEEEAVKRHDDRIAKQLFACGSTLFVQLFAGVTSRKKTSLKALLSLIDMLHERLGALELCAAPCCGPTNRPADGSFVEIVTRLLDERLGEFDAVDQAKANEASQSTNGLADAVESLGDSDSDDQGDDRVDVDEVLAQCYRCLYDVHTQPGCVDHKTGCSLVLLDTDDPSRVSCVQRLARFAIPAMLKRPPKSNSQKKENLKVLLAIQKVMDAENRLPPPSSEPSESLLQFLNPRGLLGWEAPLPVPDDTQASLTESRDSCLDHLWFLLGDNFILLRVRRRSNLNELAEMEHRIKERVGYLIKDVTQYRPGRINSWTRMGRAMKELYHIASDACILLIGRRRKISALLASAQERFGLEAPNAGAMFEDVVMQRQLFEKVREWQELGDDDARANFRVTVRLQQRDGTTVEEPLSMEAFAIRYITLVVEFARRCFLAASGLSESQVVAANLAADTLSSTQEARLATIESVEECGFLMYNMIQEYSILRHEALCLDTAPTFPAESYEQVLTAAAAYFDRCLTLAASEPDAYDVRFRLHYMKGKLLKKKRWLQRHCGGPDITEAKQILEFFARAEQEHEDGDLESAIVHAFYQLQSMRMELVLAETVTRDHLRLVCEHYFEEAPAESDEEEDKGDADESMADQGGEKKAEEVGNTENGVERPVEVDKVTVKMGKERVFEIITRSLEDPSLLPLARGWLFLNVIDALESIPDEDRYFHPSRYVLASAMYEVDRIRGELLDEIEDPTAASCAAKLDARKNVNGDGTTRADVALKELMPLFDKRRPQVVAIWLSEHVPPTKKFEELNQRQMKFDYYRLKYWKLYVRLLRECGAYSKLKEATTWVTACKEEHDVIDEMLGLALEARGVLELERVREALTSPLDVSAAPNEPTGAMDASSEDRELETLIKALGKAFVYYLDVMDGRSRLASIMPERLPRLVRTAELGVVCLYVHGRTRRRGGDLDVNATQVEHEDARVAPSQLEALATRLLELVQQQGDGRQEVDDWEALVQASREYCEETWPERLGKSKQSKGPRARAKVNLTIAAGATAAPGSSGGGGGVDAPAAGPEVAPSSLSSTVTAATAAATTAEAATTTSTTRSTPSSADSPIVLVVDEDTGSDERL